MALNGMELHHHQSRWSKPWLPRIIPSKYSPEIFQQKSILVLQISHMNIYLFPICGIDDQCTYRHDA
jgi:hypothetical protein